MEFIQKATRFDVRDKHLAEEIEYSSGNFHITATSEGVRISGVSEWMHDRDELNVFAKALAEAYRNHRLMLNRKMGQLVML